MKSRPPRLIAVFCVILALLVFLEPLTALGQNSPPPPGRPAVYEFGAKTCAPCLKMQQVMAELKASHGDKVEFRMVYVDEDRALFARYRIMLIPTQVFLNAEGKEVDRHIGVLSKEELLRKLKDLQLIN